MSKRKRPKHRKPFRDKAGRWRYPDGRFLPKELRPEKAKRYPNRQKIGAAIDEFLTYYNGQIIDPTLTDEYSVRDTEKWQSFTYEIPPFLMEDIDQEDSIRDYVWGLLAGTIKQLVRFKFKKKALSWCKLLMGRIDPKSGNIITLGWRTIAGVLRLEYLTELTVDGLIDWLNRSTNTYGVLLGVQIHAHAIVL